MLADLSKVCTRCKEEKPLTVFNRNKGRKDGRSSHCKECTAYYDRELRKKPSYKKSKHLKNRYGISLEEYNEMFEQQEGCCAICGTHQADCKKSLAVDHCHSSGDVRGLLCTNCNVGLGNFKDSLDLLLTAISYLSK